MAEQTAQPGEEAAVEVGQVWADNDWRSVGRTLEVESIDGDRAICKILTDIGGGKHAGRRRTRIALSRFKPTSTGYRLINGAGEQR